MDTALRTIPVFDRMTALADLTRSRLLLLLEDRELTVSELCAVVQIPQSTASRHLKVLSDEGWVTSRASGTSRWYAMLPARLEPSARTLWAVVREQVAGSPVAAQDRQRLLSVLAQRRTKSQEFFSSSAGQWDRLRAELFGERADLLALMALLDDGWTVGDLGCGTGRLSESLAPFVRRVVAVDASAAMLTAARERLGSLVIPSTAEESLPRAQRGVELRRGELEQLPIADGELDVAVLFLVLHYIVEPARALAEAARALRPGGRLLVVDMMPHDREEYRQQMGHVWLGFSEGQVAGLLHDAGLASARYRPLPADAEAKGPVLFAASAVKVK